MDKGRDATFVDFLNELEKFAQKILEQSDGWIDANNREFPDFLNKYKDGGYSVAKEIEDHIPCKLPDSMLSFDAHDLIDYVKSARQWLKKKEREFVEELKKIRG
ncbi:MAG: hypothetical protein HQM16_17695 [Deltaproteobacteria bacterium]|nr:hypothetical protein [Deltaproteobacteria bacterium]